MMKVRGYRLISLDEALKDKAYCQPDSYSGARGVSWIEHWAVTRGLKAPPGPVVPEFVRRQYEAIPEE